MNLHPPSVTVSTHTSAFNAIAFQSPDNMSNARMSLCTQSVHSFSFPPRPLCTAPSRFPTTICFGSRPPLIRMKQPIMRIEDRLFDRGWVRSAMATRKCGNIYFRKYFIAVRKFTNIFVLLLILMVGSRDTLFLICFTLKSVRTDLQWLLPNVNRQKMSPPTMKPVKKVFYK